MPKPRFQLPKPRIRKNKGGDVWWFQWTEYAVNPATGQEEQHHRSQVIGPCEKLSETKAEQHIAEWFRDNRPNALALEEWTFGRFYREVWWPARSRKWRRKTKLQYVWLADTFLQRIDPMPLNSIRKMHLDAWIGQIAEEGYAESTGKVLCWMVRSVLAEAFENDLIEKNPARKLEVPQMEAAETTIPLTPDQVLSIFEAPHITGDSNLMLRTMLLCGLRPGELAALRVDDLVNSVLRVDEGTDGGHRYGPTKTRKVRFVPVPPDLNRRLHAHIAESGRGAAEPVFVTQWGNMWTGMGLWGRLCPLVCQIEGLEGFMLRQCRATYATHLQGDIADIRDLVGHATAAMTLDHYRRAIPERQRASVADLERRFTAAKAKVLKMKTGTK